MQEGSFPVMTVDSVSPREHQNMVSNSDKSRRPAWAAEELAELCEKLSLFAADLVVVYVGAIVNKMIPRSLPVKHRDIVFEACMRLADKLGNSVFGIFFKKYAKNKVLTGMKWDFDEKLFFDRLRFPILGRARELTSMSWVDRCKSSFVFRWMVLRQCKLDFEQIRMDGSSCIGLLKQQDEQMGIPMISLLCVMVETSRWEKFVENIRSLKMDGEDNRQFADQILSFIKEVEDEGLFEQHFLPPRHRPIHLARTSVSDRA